MGVTVTEGDARKHRFKTKADVILIDLPQQKGLNVLEEDRYNYHEEVIQNCYGSLKCPGVMICVTLPKFTIDYGIMMRQCGLEHFAEVVWAFNFGTYRTTNYVASHFNCLVYVYGHPTYKCDRIRVPSQRQQTGDKRAGRLGRNPGDVWHKGIFERQVLGDDVFHIPRVVGNARQRQTSDPQLPMELVYGLLAPWVTQSSHVIDPTCGVGTVPLCCKYLGISCEALDIDPEKVQITKERLNEPMKDRAVEATVFDDKIL